ncbi:MAG: nucleotidyl transferase AbiEii/AbiGii toxin family protein [Scrofimicrobium sp.]
MNPTPSRDTITGRIYPRVRVHLTAHLAKARIPFHVDINLGDPIWPAPVKTRLTRLLGGNIETLGYPLSMSLAEKIVTAIERGTANTRWRDFVDISSLSSTESISGSELTRSIEVVADHWRVELAPLADVLRDMAAIAQPRWIVWRRKQHLENATPEDFQELLKPCLIFTGSVLANTVNGYRWIPRTNAWV